LSKAFKLTYRSNLRLEEAIAQIEKEVEPCKEILHWIEFCKTSKRGLLGLEGVTQKTTQEQYAEE
jgi:UDP-N-acetylglucosamine acyltransferase